MSHKQTEKQGDMSLSSRLWRMSVLRNGKVSQQQNQGDQMLSRLGVVGVMTPDTELLRRWRPLLNFLPKCH